MKLTEVTTNPNYGGLADMGSYTFVQVLAGEMRSDLPAKLVTDLQAYIRTLVAALEALLAAVRTVGDANDAADHNCNAAADRLIAAAPDRAREAWALAPDALGRVLPMLAPLGAGTFDTSRWYDIANRIEQVLR